MAFTTSSNSREIMLINQKGKCFYCGCDNPNQVDHVYPQHLGGFNHESNYVMACGSCNRIKKNYSMEDFRIRLAFSKSKYSKIIKYAEYKKLRAIGELSEVGRLTFYWEVEGLSTLKGSPLTRDKMLLTHELESEKEAKNNEIKNKPAWVSDMDRFIENRELLGF